MAVKERGIYGFITNPAHAAQHLFASAVMLPT